jgi:hypothetical protein
MSVSPIRIMPAELKRNDPSERTEMQIRAMARNDAEPHLYEMLVDINGRARGPLPFRILERRVSS